MREYVVNKILVLPLSRVEGASTGDLVTRVTRDVGTMSRAVQYGVPMAVVMLLTVLLSVGAMLLNSVLDRKSTRLNSSHANISYAVFCLKKKKKEWMTQ